MAMSRSVSARLLREHKRVIENKIKEMYSAKGSIWLSLQFQSRMGSITFISVNGACYLMDFQTLSYSQRKKNFLGTTNSPRCHCRVGKGKGHVMKFTVCLEGCGSQDVRTKRLKASRRWPSAKPPRWAHNDWRTFLGSFRPTPLSVLKLEASSSCSQTKEAGSRTEIQVSKFCVWGTMRV